MLLPSELFIIFVIHVNAISDQTEEIIPISSNIQLKCENGLRVGNIDVTIRRTNTTCLTTTGGCTLPVDAIETIKGKCNNQVACDVDVLNITNSQRCLRDFGFFNVWYTCRTSTEFSCAFESGLCNWSSIYDNDRFQWTYGLPIDYKFPKVDHTSASTAGKYAYIYQNHPSRGEIATLESMYIIPTDQQCLSFWYFTTNYRDSVYVFQNEDMLLNLSDHRKQKWQYIQISLDKKSYNSYKFVFKVVRGSWRKGYIGAIVIDDILIENQKCNSFLFQCEFDTYSCHLNRQYSHQYEWVYQNGYWWRYNPGPRYDHSTASEDGNYVYLKKNSDVRTAEGTTVYLELPNVDMIILVNSCFTFWYYMHGDRIGGLNVTLGDKLVWTKFGDQDDKWKRGMIELHKGTVTNIKFIGIIGYDWEGDIAIDDLYITEGTCKGLFDQEEICVDVEGIISKETFCPKGYLDLQNARILFDPEREKCSDIYDQTKKRLLTDCQNVANSQKCLFDLSTDIRSQPECFQLYEFRIQHTCEVSDQDVTLPTVTKNSKDLATGLVVGLVIAAVLLACVVILIVVIVRRRTFVSGPKEKITNNLRENDYIGSQDIALPQTDNPFSHIQNDDSRNTSAHGNDRTPGIAKINNVNKERIQAPAYAVRVNTTLSDNQTINDEKYSIVDQTAETSFNGTRDEETGTADNHMVLDASSTGFNRTKLSKTPTGYEFAKPVKDMANKIGHEDQYALSEEGVYDHSGSSRHKELEDTIYNHAVDTIYDSGSHKRNDEGREDTYDHFFGQKTEDDYDISTRT